MRRSLPALAIRMPITVIMLSVTVIGLGLISWQRIPVEFIPRMDMPFVMVMIPYPGATPDQVQNEIAIPAEGEFRTIPHVRSISSTSNSEGCSLRLRFDWEADMALATADIRDRIDRLKLTLPSTADQVFIRRYSANSLPVMVFSIYREGDDEELGRLARTIIQPRVMRVDGVAEAQVFGRFERQVLIEFDQDKLRSLNVGFYSLINKLQASNLNVSVGELIEGQTKYYVRVLDEARKPSDLEELPIGNGLYLRDVARVEEKPRDENFEFWIDGRGGAFVIVRKESEANTIDVCKKVQTELNALMAEPAFRGAKLFVFFDQSKMILSALDSLMTAGKEGALLAVVVLFLFLRRVRPTLIVTVAIPTSILVALVCLYFSGMTLNVVTMISLMIGIGSLVDDSIVVIENIYRHQHLGLGPVESASKGANEVAMAVVASTLTTIVVFIPIFYMQTGEMSTYMRQFAVPLTVSQLASLVVALTLIPLAASRMRPLRPFKEYPAVHALLQAPVIGALLRAAVDSPLHPHQGFMLYFGRAVGFTARWRLAALLVIVLLVLVTAFGPGREIGTRRMPMVDSREVDITAKFDQGFDLAMARDRMKRVGAVIDAHRERLGIRSVLTDFTSEQGHFRIYLERPEDSPEGTPEPMPTTQVSESLRALLPERVPGMLLEFEVAEAGESQSRGISLQLRGDNVHELDQLSQRVKGLMETIPGISEVKTDVERARDEMAIRVDNTLAQAEGASALVIARTVDFALRGVRLPYMKREGREIPVWAQFREEDRTSVGNLENVAILSSSGGLVPLKNLVTLERALSPQDIRRENGKNVVTIRAKVMGQDLRAVQARIERMSNAMNLPRGYELTMGNEFEEMRTNLSNFVMAIGLAIILIYIVMAALFESCVLPLSILTTVPLAFIGVVWAMYFTSTPMDTIAYIGVILLIGVVVKNGIVIVDHINQLRLGGADRSAAVIQASKDRFRPVMMTALTTILGCLPMATRQAMGGEVSFNSMGRALIGGLITGTLLTLLVVPLFYTMIDDAGRWFSRFLSDLASLSPSARIAAAKSETEPEG